MRALLAVLLFVATQAFAQVSSSPPLVGQKWTTAPAACSVGLLGFDTDATAGSNLFGCTSANTWTLLGGPASIAASATVPCSTSNAVLYNASTPCSANLTFDSSAKTLTIGTGSGTSAGFIAGYSGISGQSHIWSTAVTPSTTNFAFSADVNSSYMNMTASGYAIMQVAGTNKYLFSGAAGAGVTITAGTATTDVAAFSLTRTNNNAAVATGVKITFTDTTSAAGFLPFQILCGAAATTNCISVSKAGTIDHAGYSRPDLGMEVVNTGGYFGIAGRAIFTSPADGTLVASNNAISKKFFIAAALPVIGSCGTDPSVAGVDSAMKATVGTGGVATSCAVTFSAAKTTAPACIAQSNTDIVGLKVVTSTTVVTVTATAPFTAGSLLHIHCFEYL